jgi:hypothetical protein
MMKSLKRALKNLNTDYLITMIRILLDQLKNRGVIRTKNLVGDLGEYIALEYYNQSTSLPNLKAVEIGTKHIDAVSNNNDGYSIKATTTNMTSV